ncbi:MAG: DUF4384 domain-containing protein [Proteobacteria bacterium]|nr:DUF4384 domain-containing protein [Pseudomonadota bacterium]
MNVRHTPNTSIYLVLLFFTSTIFALASANAYQEQEQGVAVNYPAWFSNPNMNDNFGAVGIAGKHPDGYSRQKKTAVKIAQAELSKQIRLLLDSELSKEEHLRQSGKSEEYSSSMESFSKMSSSELLQSTIVKDEWINPENGDLYVWVVLVLPGDKETSSNKSFDVASGLNKGVEGEGSCAVINMSAEQSQLLALQRARSMAIEKAAGLQVKSSTLITNFELAVDMIRTYSSGYIVKEKVEWLPMGQFRGDNDAVPIPEYRVRIIADIYIPEKKIGPLGLIASLNRTVFRAGESASINIKAERDVQIAIFNFTADDKVFMLFPNPYDGKNRIEKGHSFSYPPGTSPVQLETQNLPGHKKDAEALFVVAMAGDYKREFALLFRPLEAMKFDEFFKKYAEISDYCEDLTLPYEIISNNP